MCEDAPQCVNQSSVVTIRTAVINIQMFCILFAKCECRCMYVCMYVRMCVCTFFYLVLSMLHYIV